MTLDSIEEYLELKKILIEKELDKLLPENSKPYSQLFHSARYSLLNGGKRIRPLLVLATCQSLKGNEEAAVIPACAIEMVHTYSLIHDDLPCMDNDDFRRGVPTSHKAFSESFAVLTGDFLLTQAFQILSKAPFLSSDQKVHLIELLATYSGGDGMVGGQVMDIESEKKILDLPSLNFLHQCKTGALLKASIEFGAIIANAESAVITHLQGFSDAIGLAFQIIDDVIDVTDSEKKHGKVQSSDITNQKTTYTSLLGVEKSLSAAKEWLVVALSHLKEIPYDTEILASMAKQMVNRRS